MKREDVERETSSKVTPLLCPLIKGYCMGKACQLWDRRISDCGLKSPLKTVSG